MPYMAMEIPLGWLSVGRYMVWKAGKLVYGIWLNVGRISFGMEITGGPEG